MHPAYSVILFTTASGAGYGLLFWLSLAAMIGQVPADRGLGLVGLGLAFVLIVAGLLSSTAHLGRPERAWRAFSQWRSSWLSREGVVSIATFVPAGLFAIGWVFFGNVGDRWAVLGLLGAALAIATVWCTGMIYQSLPTIKAWAQPLVSPIYISLSLATGAVLCLLVLRLFGYELPGLAWLTAGLIALAAVLKQIYWTEIGASPLNRTTGDATGLGRFGEVRPLEAPHTQANFVMREMGYTIARKHAAKLRRLVLGVGFGIPFLATLLSLVVGTPLSLVLSCIAVIGIGIGVAVERWLFFAEAQHIVTLYYGAKPQ
jgi:sulfite dehydrogenase (quinone) subunit SoeC